MKLPMNVPKGFFRPVLTGLIGLAIGLMLLPGCQEEEETRVFATVTPITTGGTWYQRATVGSRFFKIQPLNGWKLFLRYSW